MSKLGKVLIQGLKEALAYERGEISLRTSTVKLNKNGEVETMSTEEAKKSGNRLEITPDGKRELDYGSEALNKEPKKKKKLVERWEEIKKGLDNKSAIVDLDSLSEDEQPENDPGDASAQPNPENDEDGGVVPDDQEENPGDSSPEWLPEGIEHEGEQGEAQEGEEPQQGDPEAEEEIKEALREMGHSEAEIAHIVHGHMVPQVDEVERAKSTHEYQKANYDKESHQKDMAIRDEEADHDRQLRQKEREARNQEVEGEAEHAKRMKDIEYQRAQKESGETDLELEHKKRLQDLEYEKEKAASSFNEAKVEAEHKRRMLDLEYENAKATKALELQFKEKEHAMKLKHAEQLAQEKHKAALDMAKDDAQARKQEKKMDLQQRAVDKKEDLKISSKQKEDDRKLKSKETAQDRAKAKPVKKSDDEIDDLHKSMIGWKFNPKTQQMNHSTLGSIIVQLIDGGYNVKHNGAHVGSFKTPSEAGAGIVNYTKNLGHDDTMVGKAEANVNMAPSKPVTPKSVPPPYLKNITFKDIPKNRKQYSDILDTPNTVNKIDAQASRGEEWRSQQDDEEPHKDEPADEDSKGEKSNIAENESHEKVMQLGVSSVNSHNNSKYHGNKA